MCIAEAKGRKKKKRKSGSIYNSAYVLCFCLTTCEKGLKHVSQCSRRVRIIQPPTFQWYKFTLNWKSTETKPREEFSAQLNSSGSYMLFFIDYKVPYLTMLQKSLYVFICFSFSTLSYTRGGWPRDRHWGRCRDITQGKEQL